jgi:hypothetical protein
MSVAVGHAETANRVSFEVELDEDDGLSAHDPAIVPGLDGHNLRRFVLHDAAVGVLDVDFAAHEEPDVRVHTKVGADRRFHIDRPAEPGRIDHALDACLAGPSNLQPNVTDLAEFGAFDRCESRR